MRTRQLLRDAEHDRIAYRSAGRKRQAVGQGKLLNPEPSVFPDHRQAGRPVDRDVVGIGIREGQVQAQRVACGRLLRKPGKGDIDPADRSEIGIDEPRETPPVRQTDRPDAPGCIDSGRCRALDEHLPAGEARVVVAELPLVGPVTDVGLAIGLAARIEAVLGRHRIVVAEDDRTAVGLGGDGPVALRIVEDLEADAQRVEDHLEAHEHKQCEGYTACPHDVAPRAGMAADIAEEHGHESEAGNDHPLRLHVAPEGREQEKENEGHRQELQRPAGGRLRPDLTPRLHAERHEEGVEDHEHVGQELHDIVKPEDRVARREVVDERRPVVVVLPDQVRHEQQGRHGPRKIERRAPEQPRVGRQGEEDHQRPVVFAVGHQAMATPIHSQARGRRSEKRSKVSRKSAEVISSGPSGTAMKP